MRRAWARTVLSSCRMRERLAVRLAVAEAEYQAAQQSHNGTSLACAKYREALAELEAASQAVREALERLCPS